MAWSDEPTIGQLSAIERLIKWEVDNKTKAAAVDWIKEHATRREASYEMKRLRELAITRRLNKEKVFEGEIWEGFIDD